MDKSSKEFNELNLEEKAKLLLKNYYNEEEVYYNCNPGILIKAWEYIKDNGYFTNNIEITQEGLEWISDFYFTY